MKQRIKIDISLLLILVGMSGVLLFNKRLFLYNACLNNIMFSLGLVMILKGILLRMSARAHKKNRSKESESLVTSGPYALTRNPMYLGSFELGLGFVFIVWPWWSFPVFAYIFYLRFNRQMVKEEGYLISVFNQRYVQYCKEVPRLFPRIKKLISGKMKDLYNLDESFGTKEKRGLIGWPLLGILLEMAKRFMVVGRLDLYSVSLVALSTIVVFAIIFNILYKYK